MAIKPIVSPAIMSQKIVCSWNIPVHGTFWYGMQRFLLTTREKQQVLPSKKVLQRIAINSQNIKKSH